MTDEAADRLAAARAGLKAATAGMDAATSTTAKRSKAGPLANAQREYDNAVAAALYVPPDPNPGGGSD